MEQQEADRVHQIVHVCMHAVNEGPKWFVVELSEFRAARCSTQCIEVLIISTIYGYVKLTQLLIDHLYKISILHKAQDPFDNNVTGLM